MVTFGFNVAAVTFSYLFYTDSFWIVLFRISITEGISELISYGKIRVQFGGRNPFNTDFFGCSF